MSIKERICLNNKILRTLVDAHADIPNMHRASLYHNMLRGFFNVHFGAFSMEKLALKCTSEFQ